MNQPSLLVVTRKQACILLFVTELFESDHQQHIQHINHPSVATLQEAVRTLNTLQSNAAVLEKARQLHALKQLSLPETVQFASRAGISVSARHVLIMVVLSKWNICLNFKLLLHNIYDASKIRSLIKLGCIPCVFDRISLSGTGQPTLNVN